MAQNLALHIWLHDARYHGVPEWPPAPARVFQALVAGAAEGSTLPESSHHALEWLERRPPPVIAHPRARAGQAIEAYVPNNDSDALDGDLQRLPEIRTKKTIRPYLLETPLRFLYLWSIDEDAPTSAIVDAAERLYQLGRGVDMAWATAEICDDDSAERRLAAYPGVVLRPAQGNGRRTLACPTDGSVASLVARHRAAATRLRRTPESGNVTLFAQPPKPRFAEVAYGSPPARLVYELRRVQSGETSSGEPELYPWPPWRVVSLVERLRDRAVERLRHALPNRSADIERCMVGRKSDGTGQGRPSERVRIIPLPSVGHEHADRAIRRVAVEIPAEAALSADDVHWAFSALDPSDPETGELDRFMVTPANADPMIKHFDRSARVWRTVTPAALPDAARRRRIEPRRKREEAKGAEERNAEQQRAVDAVFTALRHEGVTARPGAVVVQREPYHRKGARAERFAVPPRFYKERLWHVELTFGEPICGPLVIGDGRFLGLGLFEAVAKTHDGFAFAVDGGLTGKFDAIALSRALRRALMSRVQQVIGRRPLPELITGHDPDGQPVRGDGWTHLAFHANAGRLLIFSPHRVAGRAASRVEREWLATIDDALAGFSSLRAGASGELSLRAIPLASDDECFGVSRSWRSASPYTVQRHRRAGDANVALAQDIIEECVRHGLPRPTVRVLKARAVSGRGLEGELELSFPAAIAGPVLLGRTRYLGGGLFLPR